MANWPPALYRPAIATNVAIARKSVQSSPPACQTPVRLRIPARSPVNGRTMSGARTASQNRPRLSSVDLGIGIASSSLRLAKESRTAALPNSSA